MAFHLPTHPPQRQQSYLSAAHTLVLNVTPSAYQQEDEDSQEWVVFSPSQAPQSPTSLQTISTERTPRTAGLSRLSDFGSLETTGRSDVVDDELGEAGDSQDFLEDDITELDSLDDGLHAFNELATYRATSGQLHQSHAAVLPTHDGLGTFAASSQTVQEQLWQHEQYNPRRRGDIRHRRRSSVQRQLDAVDEIASQDLERERWQRIEQWRMEQSRALLQEIERETRRRRNSRASLANERLLTQRSPNDVESMARSKETTANQSSAVDPPPARQQQDDADDEESFWRRITRKVIRDLMGIDDSLLCVIFGEALPPLMDEEEGKEVDDEQEERQAQKKLKSSIAIDPGQSPDMDQMMKDIRTAPQSDAWWQERLLERIARELGILVHQICEHPGAFSTYLRTSVSPSSEYAGMPVSRHLASSTSSRPLPPSRNPSNTSIKNPASTYSPYFAPTLQDAATSRNTPPWGIEEEPYPALPVSGNQRSTSSPTPDLAASAANVSDITCLDREREYWERELDIKMVFRYLRSHFGSKNTGTTNSPPRRRASATVTQQDPAHRAAVIRHHHPLVARAHACSQSQSQRPSQWRTRSTSGSGPVVTGAGANLTAPPPPVLHHMRPSSSSCASLSTKVSVSTKRTGSSRHYWDIGGSVGSSSAIVAAGGGIGSWGDV